MPRTRRLSIGGLCYHATNRGNRKATVFHDDADYRRFLDLIRQAGERVPMRVLGWCLMPNHFHLVLWPRREADMSRWMQWLLTKHARGYNTRRGLTGRVWQGRFKASPIQQDRHLLNVLRYVERNPLRADLVAASEEWPWSSLPVWLSGAGHPFLHRGPVDRFADWLGWVNEPQTVAELEALRRSIHKETPYGSEHWILATTEKLGCS